MTESSFFMIRLLDHAGYYETRFVLAILAACFAAYAFKRSDPRFAIAFAFGAVFQTALEWTLQSYGLRGDYALSVFGTPISGTIATILQGIVEGGPLSLMGYWFVRVAQRDLNAVGSTRAYVAGIVVVFILAAIAAMLAFGSPMSSARPIRFLDPLLLATVLFSIIVSLLRGLAGLRLLGLFFVGVLIYAVATFEVLHVAGVRYIGIGTADNITAAALPAQIGIMLASLAIEISAAKLHYFAVPLVLGLYTDKTEKSAPTVVFLHGWLMNPSIWASAERVITPQSSVVNLWQPAHGDEPGLPENASLKDWSAWLFAKIGETGTPVVLVGHSMGALVAIQAALDRPDRVAGLVLSGASSRPWSAATVVGWRAMAGAATHSWSIETARSLAPWLLNAKLAKNESFLERWNKDVAAHRLNDMASLVEAIATRPATEDRLAAISAPTLVIHGAEDASIPLEEAEFIAGAIGNAELVVIPNAGHCPPLETPEDFTEHLSAFLQKRGLMR
jgi:pimeloyl-ACP methyl ester carboxylesterase